MEKENYRLLDINKFDIKICNDIFECRVFWARIISSERQSLFTNNTKHTFYEIQYALDGCMGMLINEDECLHINNSEFIIVPPDIYHQVVDGDSSGARFIMAFDINPSRENLKYRLKQLLPISVYKETESMRLLISMIPQKDCRDDEVRNELIKSLLEAFLLEILGVISPDTSVDYDKNKTERNSKRVEEIKSYIQKFNGIGISVSDVAKHFHISERQLNRILTSETGRTAGQLIGSEKMKKIEEFMATTTLSLNEISELSGFSDEYSMNKFFRRHAKTNLSDFRKIVRQKKKAVDV